MLLTYLLNHLIRVGSLSVIDANGKCHLFEGASGPVVTIRLHDKALHHRLFINPSLALGESYTNGTLTVEDASLYDFLDLLGLNMERAGHSQLNGITGVVIRVLRRVQQFNPVGQSLLNSAKH